MLKIADHVDLYDKNDVQTDTDYQAGDVPMLSLLTTKMFTKTKIIKLENLTKGRSQLVTGGRRKQR